MCGVVYRSFKFMLGRMNVNLQRNVGVKVLVKTFEDKAVPVLNRVLEVCGQFTAGERSVVDIGSEVDQILPLLWAY